MASNFDFYPVPTAPPADSASQSSGSEPKKEKLPASQGAKSNYELELEQLYIARLNYALENNLDALGLCFLMMGNVFRGQADYFLARWYYHQSLYIYQKTRSRVGIVRSLQSLSSLNVYQHSHLA